MQPGGSSLLPHFFIAKSILRSHLGGYGLRVTTGDVAQLMAMAFVAPLKPQLCKPAALTVPVAACPRRVAVTSSRGLPRRPGAVISRQAGRMVV